MKRFKNRAEAGQLLAERLASYAQKSPIVLALPRGGLPVAYEIAKALHAPLDILAVKKIGAPLREELAVGAVSEDGVPVYNEEILAAIDPSRRYVNEAAKLKANELHHQVALYRNVKCPEPIAGRTVIVVDDGLATGASMDAAIQVIRKKGAAETVIAVPIASPEAFSRIRERVDELVALEVPNDFYAVGIWFDDFAQITDSDALEYLRRNDQNESPDAQG